MVSIHPLTAYLVEAVSFSGPVRIRNFFLNLIYIKFRIRLWEDVFIAKQGYDVTSENTFGMGWDGICLEKLYFRIVQKTFQDLDRVWRVNKSSYKAKKRLHFVSFAELVFRLFCSRWTEDTVLRMSLHSEWKHVKVLTLSCDILKTCSHSHTPVPESVRLWGGRIIFQHWLLFQITNAMN